MRRPHRATGLVGACLLIGALAACNPRQPWRSDVVTPPGIFDQFLGAPTTWAFSPDGTKVAFTTFASNLGPTDTTVCTPFGTDLPCPDVYLRDLTTGEITLVSVNAAGTNSGNGPSERPAFSPDGTKIAFVSRANDLGPSDTSLCPLTGLPGTCADVYLRDLTTGTTTLVSVDATGTDGSNATTDVAHAPVFSADGTKIAFTTPASNLGPTDTNSLNDIYVRDLVAATTTLATTNALGSDSGNAQAWPYDPPIFTADGTKLAFASLASNLGAVDTNRSTDVYIRDLAAATTSLVSVNGAGTAAGDGGTSEFSLSPDDTRVVFTSFGTDLGYPDGNGAGDSDVYIRDLLTGTTSLVSVNEDGTAGGNGTSADGRFSPDGTRVAFGSSSSDLGDRDTNGEYDIYLRDLASGTTNLVTRNRAGTDAANGGVRFFEFSLDGEGIVNETTASDMGPRDTNDEIDVYFHDLASAPTTLVSSNVDGTDSGNGSSHGRFLVGGDRVAFVSLASNLTPDVSTAGADIYVAAIRDADVSVTATAGPNPVPAGGTVTYEVVFTNDGPDPARTAVGALVLPDETGAVSVSGGGTCAEPPPEPPRAVVCQLGNLGPGQQLSLTVTAEVTGPAGSTIRALAAVVSSFPDPDETDNLIHVTSTVS